jgi:hypothetical protein
MNRYRFLLVAVLAGPWALSAASADRDKADPAAAGAALPPVLRASEPSDSGIVLLPGPAPVVVITVAPPKAPPVARPILPAPLPARPVETALRPVPPKPVASSLAGVLATVASLVTPDLRPAAGSHKAGVHASFERDAAEFCQKQIGRWKQSDARNLFGKPLRERPALDEKKAINGRIYAFSDPSGRNKELELDFDIATGSLRTVFAYPAQMTWRECLARWSGTVTSADAQQGRTFYSYVNRHLDVLVDNKGKVISLGMY